MFRLFHTRSLRSLRSCRKKNKTETLNLNPLSSGPFCTTATTQKTKGEPGFRKSVICK